MIDFFKFASHILALIKFGNEQVDKCQSSECKAFWSGQIKAHEASLAAAREFRQ